MSKGLVGVYYPFSLPLSDETLKRALLMFDEVAFVDPVTPRIREGWFDEAAHQHYLPSDAPRWEVVNENASARTLDPLIAAGVARYLDPTPLLDSGPSEQAMTDALQGDMARPETFALFGDSPPVWCILRSRIPRSTFPFLHHQYTTRVLYDENITRPFSTELGYHALFADGKPDQEFGSPPYPGSRPDVDGEFACVVPYYLGSSLALSLALAICQQIGGTLFTDSGPHRGLLSLRRATETPEAPSSFEQPLFLLDSGLSSEDLAGATVEQVLEIRSILNAERRAASDALRRVTSMASWDRASLEGAKHDSGVEIGSRAIPRAYEQVTSREPGPQYIRTTNRIIGDGRNPPIVWVDPKEREYAPGPTDLQLRPRAA